MNELFRQFAADSARIRPYPRGVRRCPPNVRRTFGGVHRKIFLADVRRIRAEPGGVRAFPRGFGRNRGGRSSAEPIALTSVQAPSHCHHCFHLRLRQTLHRQSLAVDSVFSSSFVNHVTYNCIIIRRLFSNRIQLHSFF